MKVSKIFTSSVNSNELALTIKGLLVGLVPVIMLLLGLNNISVGQEQINSIIEAIVNVVVAVSTVISTVMIAVGVVRRFLVEIGVIK
jgi:hypothetical protein